MSEPDFIFVGPGRAGTTFIYHYLSSHAEVCLAKDTKEVNFFNDFYETKDISWYKSFFRDKQKHQVCGEVSNMYFYDPSVAGKIKRHFPSARIIVTLRNPYERIKSAYQFRLSVGEIFDISLDEALQTHKDLIDQNRYYTLLKAYYDCFDSEQIHVLFYDDLKNDQGKFLAKINEILGISHVDLQPDDSKTNSGKAPRFKLLTKLSRFLADFLRKYHLYKLHTYLKNNSLVRKLVFTESNASHEFSDTSKALIEGELREELKSLSSLLGRDLSHWTP